jgi:DNA ligase-1
MHAFAALVNTLYYLNSSNAKAQVLIEYLERTEDPERGWAIAAIAGTLSFEFFTRATIKNLILEKVDAELFALSYDYVGEMSETVAHLWSTTPSSISTHQDLPALAEIIEQFKALKKNQVPDYLSTLLDKMTSTQRWALLKLGTRGLRIGVSARSLKKVLAQFAQQHNQNITIEDIEQVWHGVKPPYIDLFAWLEGNATKPNITDQLTFQPVMLSQPFQTELLNTIVPSQWCIEWKFDGIRAQLLINKCGVALYSRTGEDISQSFPDLIERVKDSGIVGRFDGELVSLKPGYTSNGDKLINYDGIASFNQLQQRLNKKKPSKRLLEQVPVGLILYDALEINEQDVRNVGFVQRQQILSSALTPVLKISNSINESKLNNHCGLFISEQLPFTKVIQLADYKEQATHMSNGYIEGVMLKYKSGSYVSGRPKGQWYKLKRDPLVIDAVMMYAQRGHGKRSSFYSDYTFGCWSEGQLLPVGKAYSGFTDEELKKLDAWIRRNSIGRFGPVKEVKKELVCELAFDAVNTSNRHKSKVAMRFPRINRIRWDKPANEADTLENLTQLIAKR